MKVNFHCYWAIDIYVTNTTKCNLKNKDCVLCEGLDCDNYFSMTLFEHDQKVSKKEKEGIF